MMDKNDILRLTKIPKTDILDSIWETALGLEIFIWKAYHIIFTRLIYGTCFKSLKLTSPSQKTGNYIQIDKVIQIVSYS